MKYQQVVGENSNNGKMLHRRCMDTDSYRYPAAMRITRILFFLQLLPTLLMGQNLNLENPVRFLALGDSYTIGQSVPVNERWPEQLSDSLNNRGILTDTLTIIATTGWRTDNLLNAIRNQGLENRNYNLVSLLIGVNNQYQGRPFSQYVTEFPALLDSAIRYAGGDKSHVFVVSIPDYAFTPFGQQSSNPAQISEEIDQYNAYSKQVADSLDITYFDITPISRLGLQNPSYVANDGLHPSGIQYTEWVKLMLDLIDSQTTNINIADNNILDVNIFPNPAVARIEIEMGEATHSQNVRVQIFNLDGNLVLEQTQAGISCSLSIAELPIGLYLVKVIMGEKWSIRKFVRR